MLNVLNKNEYNINEKVKLYNDLLSKYIDINNQIDVRDRNAKNIIIPQILNSSNKEPEENINENDLINEQNLNEFDVIREKKELQKQLKKKFEKIKNKAIEKSLSKTRYFSPLKTRNQRKKFASSTKYLVPKDLLNESYDLNRPDIDINKEHNINQNLDSNKYKNEIKAETGMIVDEWQKFN